jgi:hypothetical protein
MKVVCRGRTNEDLPAGYTDVRAQLGEGPFPLTIGKTYVVFAIEASEGRVSYYVHDDDGLQYPMWYAAPLFQIADATPSRHWVCAYDPPMANTAGVFVLSFPDWASDRYFFKRPRRRPASCSGDILAIQGVDHAGVRVGLGALQTPTTP